VTGQPSDHLGEDLSEFYTDLTERWHFNSEVEFLTFVLVFNWVILVS
jgi:hypothetical protein